MREGQREECRKSQESPVVATDASPESGPPSQEFKFAKCGGTFDHIFRDNPDAMADAFQIAQMGGKGAGAAGMVMLKNPAVKRTIDEFAKDFPDIVQKVVLKGKKLFIALYEKHRGGEMGEQIGSVTVPQNANKATIFEKIREMAERWDTRRAQERLRQIREEQAREAAAAARKAQLKARALE